MNQKSYIVLYGNKKPEDNIIIKNMFQNTMEINLGWIDADFHNNMKIIENSIQERKVNQIIFSGFEIGWDRLVNALKEKYKEVKIKVICNTNDSLLYYEYERNNFFKLLELSKEGQVDDIAFFRQGQYNLYKSLGYNCSYLRENYKMDKSKKNGQKSKNENIELGIYPLNYTWDKNIFNQLCISKFVDRSHLNYNNLDPRMEDFLTTMKIDSTADKIENIDEDNIIRAISKNDVIIATSFTEYVHPIFFISMELGIPCLIGNNSDFFGEQDELKKCVVSSAEDNPIINAKMVNDMQKNKDQIVRLYTEWKEQYNKRAEDSINEFLNK